MTDPHALLCESLQHLSVLLQTEEDYLLPSSEKSDQLVQVMKRIYDSSTAASTRKFGSLQSLIVAGVDEDSIWEELQTRIRPLVNFFEKKAKKLIDKLEAKKTLAAKPLYGDNGSEDEEELAEEPELSDQEDAHHSDGESEESAGSARSESDMEEDPLSSEEDSEEETSRSSEREDSRPPRDDAYGSDEDVDMEAWLDDFEEMERRHAERQERREQRLRQGQEYDEDDEEDDQDDDLSIAMQGMYDTDMEEGVEESGDEEEDQGEGDEDDASDSDTSSASERSSSLNNRKGMKGKKGRKSDQEIRYEDFFVADKRKPKDARRKPVVASPEASPDASDASDASDVETEDEAPAKLSKQQQRKKMMVDHVRQLEDELLAGKSWELRGEVRASDRPENSLLNVVADIERNAKAAPIITQEFTSSLEELIIKRIQDERFDDPKPGRRPSLSALQEEGAQASDLSQDKSNKGLGDLYAEEYARTVLKVDTEASPEMDALRTEVLSLFNKLSHTLDRLSHFYYTPKPVTVESSAQVLANQRLMAAVEMEERGLLPSQSTALRHSPEEIANRPRNKIDLLRMTASEYDNSDVKQRRRRTLKKLFKHNKLEYEQTHAQSKTVQEKKLTEQLRADKRVTLTDTASTKRKREVDANSKSSAFFGKLQEAVEGRDASAAKKKSRTEATSSSAAFKL